MNRMLKMTSRLNHSKEYSYDFSGNIVSFKDGNKNITEYNYDVGEDTRLVIIAISL